jgi:hypothetical protein
VRQQGVELRREVLWRGGAKGGLGAAQIESEGATIERAYGRRRRRRRRRKI